MPGFPRVGFLKPLVDRKNIEIGDYTYYDDPDGPEHFVRKCVLYHYDFVGDRLVVGRQPHRPAVGLRHDALHILGLDVRLRHGRRL